jgi:hypothetical protein
MAHLEHLTAQEQYELDAADGVVDGKVHGVDASKFKHDKSKSTKEGEWEFRDGKYYRRDYYASTVEKEKPAPPPPRPAPAPVVVDDRDRIIAELRREIAELRRLLGDRDHLISELRIRIQSLEVQITEARLTIVEEPIVVDNSYYVVRSQRGAALLNAYGKTNIEINPYQAPMPNLPVVPAQSVVHPYMQGSYYNAHLSGSYYTPVERTMATHVTTMHVAPREAITTSHVSVKTSGNEYYRVEDEAMRRKLDLMDGVEDGRLNGADIRVTGHSLGSSQAAGRSSTTTTTRVHASVSGNEYYRVEDEATRKRLDMMDGVEDGKLNGAQITVGHVGGALPKASPPRVTAQGRF